MDRAAIEDVTALLQRTHVLSVCQDGALSRSAIAEHADCSRATAYRATKDLEARGLLEKVADGYRLTGSGQAALTHVQHLRASVGGARHLQPVLDHADSPRFVAHTHLFTDATVVEADPDAPYAVEQHIESIIGDATERMFGITSGFGSPKVMETTYDIIRDGVEVEWVLTQATFEGVRAQHGEGHDELRDLDHTATYIVDEAPLDFGVYDDTLVVAGFDAESGTAAAVASTDDPDAVQWARRLFETYRERGERID